MKNLPISLALTWAIYATYQLGPVMAEQVTLAIALQGISVLMAWGLVKLVDVYTRRAEEF